MLGLAFRRAKPNEGNVERAGSPEQPSAVQTDQTARLQQWNTKPQHKLQRTREGQFSKQKQHSEDIY